MAASTGLLWILLAGFAAFALASPPAGAAQKGGVKGKRKPPAEEAAPGDAPPADPDPSAAAVQKTYEPPPGAKPYEAPSRPTDGRCLAASIRKLKNEDGASKPFLFYMVGSSYTNRLGQGEEFKALLRARFPKAPEIVVKRVLHMGTPYRGFLQDVDSIAADKPDLVLFYTYGSPADLEQFLLGLRAKCSADIVIPSVHWTAKERSFWEQGKEPPGAGSPGVERGMSTNWDLARSICATYGVEFVDSRNEIAEWMRANRISPPDLLVDSVHQKPYLAHMIRMNVVRHLNPDFREAAPPPVKPPEPVPIPPSPPNAAAP